MVTVSQIDNVINAKRESLLSTISNTSGNVQAQSIFLAIAVLMAIAVVMELLKGTDERKGILGPLAIMILSLSIMFGFKIMTVGYIIFFCLILALSAKFKQGEWKGAFVILLVLYGLAFLLSVNTYMMIGIAAIVSIAGWMIKSANFQKVFGRSDAARELNEAGVPVTKERRLIRALGRIAHKGFRWSKDKLVRTAGKLKQRFAERALENEAMQLREAEIVMAGEHISRTLDQEEENIAAIEARDGRIIEEISMRCAHLDDYVGRLPDGSVEAYAQQYIAITSHQILKMTNELAKTKISEESMMEKANKIFTHSMIIINHSAHEATQLEEHKSQFREMKNAAVTNIEAMRKAIKKEEKELQKAIHNERQSKAEDKETRINLMQNRINGLTNVSSKLADVERFLIKIENNLMQITTEENASINEIRNISTKAKEHERHIHIYTDNFKKNAKELTHRQQRFNKIVDKEAGTVVLAELSIATDGTLEVLQILQTMSTQIAEYHERELVPLMQELAKTAKSISGLSKVSENLTKLYYQLSKANEALTRLAAEVDRNPQSKQQLEQIWKTEQFEENVIRKEYRGGKAVVSHIEAGYKHLERAYNLTSNNLRKLKNQENMVKTAHERIKKSLLQAFERVARKEESQQRREQQFAGQAATAEVRSRQAGRAAQSAGR
jgi:hypothetical protein